MLTEFAKRILDSAYQRGQDTVGRDESVNELFWKRIDIENRPDGIYIATSSNRKRLLMALQLALLNGNHFPDELASFETDQNPLNLMRFLKETFYNGNGTARDCVLLGHLCGVPVYAHPNNGETGDPGATQISEATAKAQVLAVEIREDSDLQAGNFVTVGIDTMDMIAPSQMSDVEAHPLTKPSSLLKELSHYDRNNSQDVQRFINEYIAKYFSAGHELRGVTAVVAVDRSAEVLEALTTRLVISIDESEVKRVMGNFDLDGSGGGLLQFLIDFEEKRAQLFSGSPEIKERFEGQPDERRAQEYFFVLCQIVGVPLGEIITVIRRGLLNKQDEALRSLKERAIEADLEINKIISLVDNSSSLEMGNFNS